MPDQFLVHASSTSCQTRPPLSGTSTTSISKILLGHIMCKPSRQAWWALQPPHLSPHLPSRHTLRVGPCFILKGRRQLRSHPRALAFPPLAGMARPPPSTASSGKPRPSTSAVCRPPSLPSAAPERPHPRRPLQDRSPDWDSSPDVGPQTPPGCHIDGQHAGKRRHPRSPGDPAHDPPSLWPAPPAARGGN